jgi:endoglucanase
MNRRQFMGTTVGAALALAAGARAETAPAAPDAARSAVTIPRWRGFNLHPFFGGWNNGQPVEEDYRLIAELGFNFVRLPLWYTHWADSATWREVREPVLAKLDEAVALGRQYGLHTCLAMHRAPGYCVAKEPPEPFDLFKDPEALEAFCFHWQLLAQRYASAPPDQLSFNLLNEPIATRKAHEHVVRTVVPVIRAAQADRLIFADGLNWGQTTLPELRDLGLVQSTRGYSPHTLTHYKASWVEGADAYPLPTWPMVKEGRTVFDRANLEKAYARWGTLKAEGVPVHCGECGCFKETPHDVFLRWFADLLDVLTGHEIGYALWEFRGTFGILNSERTDVTYEEWQGHKLDRKLLELLKAH